MKVLFLNPAPERCGVHQYGMRLFRIIELSKIMQVTLVNVPMAAPIDASVLDPFDVVIYNRHPGINNALMRAPYPTKAKQVAIFHEGTDNIPFDLWLFSDSSAPGYGRLVTIGRPLPYWQPLPRQFKKDHPVTIGLSGLVGAWATTMVQTVASQLPEAKIRLHLAASDHCDAGGEMAREIGRQCQAICGSQIVEINHDFMTEKTLLGWLERNDMNCYIRTNVGSHTGISSALDMAMAVQRPIAINNNPMFRHLARVSPEICIENLSLGEILALGLKPLAVHYRRNDRHVVREEVERALQSLLSNPA
jgi:hypothetical protein